MIRNSRIATIAVVIFLFGCGESKQDNGDRKTIDGNVTPGTVITKITELDRDSCSIHWYGAGIFSLCFEKGRVYYFFNAQCIYWYPTEVKKDKLIFFWDLNENCTFDRGLKNNYRLDSFPIIGKPFGEFTLVNDSILKATYYYPEWVRMANLNARDVDTLFPIILKRKRN